MSRHEGVSCDFCMKSNFRGRRYKCLICYDYDLCAQCYETHATSTRHTTEHAVQCILTRSLVEVSYGSGTSTRQLQSFTCPYCRALGFSDASLLEHVTAEHSDSALEVICPVCAVTPSGEPNLVTDDLAEHLTLEHHRGGGTFEFINEPSAIRHGGVRRISGRAAVGGVRTRRPNPANPNFSPSTLQPADRESVDLLAELQQTLAGGSRRQLQQLQMQVQMERQQIENRITSISRRPGPASVVPGSGSNQASISLQRILSAMSGSGSGGGGHQSRAGDTNFMTSTSTAAAVGSVGNSVSSSAPVTYSSVTQLSLNPPTNQLATVIGACGASASYGQFLMPRFLSPTVSAEDQERLERDRADRSQFIQELLVSTIDELSQIAIEDPPNEAASAHAVHVDPEMTLEAAALPPYGAHSEESLKKSVNRKKEITPEEQTKKLKSKMCTVKP